MKVKELIEMLQEHDPELTIVTDGLDWTPIERSYYRIDETTVEDGWNGYGLEPGQKVLIVDIHGY